MHEYVVLGTSHEVQDTFEFEKPLTDAVMKQSLILIADEYPFKCPSRVRALAGNMRIPYLQIDTFPDDWAALGIDHEMRAREDQLVGRDIRLSNADSVRENLWLEKIGASLDCGRVLVICGYLHVKFLAQRVEERGGVVIEKTTFPANLFHRKPDMVLDPAALEGYLKKLRADGVYSKRGNPLGHGGEAETR